MKFNNVFLSFSTNLRGNVPTQQSAEHIWSLQTEHSCVQVQLLNSLQVADSRLFFCSNMFELTEAFLAATYRELESFSAASWRTAALLFKKKKTRPTTHTHARTHTAKKNEPFKVSFLVLWPSWGLVPLSTPVTELLWEPTRTPPASLPLSKTPFPTP